MFRLALRTLNFRKKAFVASFIVLFFGAVIVMATGGVMETGLRLAAPPQRLTAPILVADKNYVSERSLLSSETLQKIKDVPGVASAIPDISFPAAIVQNNVPITTVDTLLAHGWASTAITPYRLVSGNAPAASQVVVSTAIAKIASVSIGDSLEIVIRGIPQTFTVSGTVQQSNADDEALFLNDATAGTLLGKTGSNAVAVIPEAGVSEEVVQQRLAAALDKGTLVFRGDDRGTIETPTVSEAGETLVVISAPFGGLAIMIIIFVAGSTLALLVRQRQREMALLRAIGATPGQLRRMILGETFVLGIIATLLAAIPAKLLGNALIELLGKQGIIPETIMFTMGIIPIAVGVVATLLIALIAALIAAKTATAIKPIEALSEAAIPRRLFTGAKLAAVIILFSGATALSLVTALAMHGPVASSTAGPSAILWTAVIGILTPLCIPLVIVVATPVTRMLFGISGKLALLNGKARRLQLAAIITPVLLTVAFSLSMLYQQTTLSEATRQAYTGGIQADVFVTSSVGGFPAETLKAIRQIPGVMAASGLVTSQAYFIHTPQATPPTDEDEADASDGREEDTSVIQGISADGLAAASKVATTSGTLTALHGNTIALPDTIAAKHGYVVGDSVDMRMADGNEISLKIVAIFAGNQGYENAFLPLDLVVSHTESELIPQILVRAQHSDEASVLAATISQRQDLQPGILAGDRAAFTKELASGEVIGLLINYLLVGTLVGYTVITLINTLLVATTERRREFALQRLVGATRGQIMRMVTAEALIAAGSGVVLATIILPFTLAPLSLAVSNSLIPKGPLWIYLAIVVVAFVLTLAATLLPTWFALRSRPIEEVAARE